MEKSYDEQIKSLKDQIKVLKVKKMRHDFCKNHLQIGRYVRDISSKKDVYVTELHDYHFKAQSEDFTVIRHYMYADVGEPNGFDLYL